MASKVGAISSSRRISNVATSWPSRRAVASTSRISSILTGLPALAMTARPRRPGTTSCNSSSRLSATSVFWSDNPVTLPPGRGRLATRPLPMGSPATAKTNRDHRCGLLSRRNGGSSIGDDNVDVEPNELSCQFGIALAASLRIPIFNREIATFDPAELAQPLHKSSDPLTFSRRRSGPQVPDDRQLPRLLPARCKGPRDSRAEQRDELAAPHHHSITSSASASTVGGIVRPSALAVLRLITSSNLVGR